MALILASETARRASWAVTGVRMQGAPACARGSLGSFEVFSPSRSRIERDVIARRWIASRAAFETGGDRTARHQPRADCRTPSPAPRSCTWPKTASASTASRRQMDGQR